MKIVAVETFILHVPVTGSHIADSVHSITHWGAPGALIRTDAGIEGYGYTGTHAHLPTDHLITGFIAHTATPLLLGEKLESATDIERLWRKVYHHPPAQWIGRAGISHLALAAIDIALWDIVAKLAGQPLWKLLSGDSRSGDSCVEPKPLEAYNTDGGWLNLEQAQLVDNAQRLVDEGFYGIKIKIGLPEIAADVARIAAVRGAIGHSVKLMVDANGKLDLATALQYEPHLREHDIYWVEEPLWYDDVQAHRELAAATQTPVALGEQLYSAYDFLNFMNADAVRFVQADATRLAGISEWRRVADAAHKRGLPVVPHAGDMSQIHIHPALAHPACAMLEYIPWLRECFTEPVKVRDGYFERPQQPGVGATLRDDALERFGVLI
jgi:L-alanine-DL-glutamate epimerase-like enolase superfamily enzyme